MKTIDKIEREAQKLTVEQLREALSMAKGMDAANKIAKQEQSA